MHLINEHIISHIKEFISYPDASFNSIFKEIQNPKKEKFKDLLLYVSRILNMTFTYKQDNLNTLHFHFEKGDDEIKSLIAEFLVIYLFYSGLKEDPKDGGDTYIEDQVNLLKSKRNKLQPCPEGASGKNKNKIYKEWQSEKHNTLTKLAFYQRMPHNAGFEPKTILNTSSRTLRDLVSIFSQNCFGTEINNKNDLHGYVLLNTLSFKSIKDKKICDKPLLKQIQHIVMFDCESNLKEFSEFSSNYLLNLNKNHRTNFKDLIIITFERSTLNLNSLRKKIELIRDRYKIPTSCSYTILAEELSYLSAQGVDSPLNTNFYGERSSISWDYLVKEAKIRELYEIRSVKMMNIYSLVFNSDIKQYILNDIFSKNSKFLSSETTLALSEVDDNTLHLIRSALSQTLEMIIKSDWHQKIIDLIGKEDITLILPANVLKNNELKTKITNSLGLSEKCGLSSWKDLDFQDCGNILALAYQDQGNFRYYFFPNLLEIRPLGKLTMQSAYLSLFFEKNYEWASYNLNDEKRKLLDHPIRRKSFNWDKLTKKIQFAKPDKPEDINWLIETEYTSHDTRIVIKVTTKDSGSGEIHTRNFNPSDLFITRSENSSKLRVQRIIDLQESDIKESNFSVQHLDNIQEKINIYESLNNPHKLGEELRVIRERYNVNESEPGRLWKILLKRSSKEKGEEILYNQLDTFFKNKGLKIVTLSHFRNNWLDPSSDSLTPLSKKVFRALCDFLELPRTYTLLMQRMKNASVQESRQSNKRMNNLLMDLFNDGCFDDLEKAKEVLTTQLEKYKEEHPLEDIGIGEDHLLTNLIVLTELIHPEIKLNELLGIEIVTQ